MRKALVALLVLLLAALFFWRGRDKPENTGQTQAAGSSAPTARSGLPPVVDLKDPAANAIGPRPSEPEGLTPEEIEAVRNAIDNLEFVFRDFATAVGGNPVGTNAEITAALRGDNEKQVKLEIPSGSTMNPRGELCDPWGTPWFFHQLSGTKMEIRSAGKDRELYTEDDFVR